jgi:hypothetical protein
MKKALLFLVLAAAAGAAGAQEMEPGEWQFTSTATSAMFPQPQTSVTTHCVRKEDAADPSRWMGNKPDSDCKMTLQPRSGDRQAFEFACSKSGMRGGGTIRHGRDSVQSELRMAGTVQGQSFEISTSTSGKRLGPCRS